MASRRREAVSHSNASRRREAVSLSKTSRRREAISNMGGLTNVVFRCGKRGFVRLSGNQAARTVVRLYTTRMVPELLPEVLEAIDAEEMNPKKHPGRMHRAVVQLPRKVMKAAKVILADQNMTQLQEDAMKLSRILEKRQLPPEKEEVQQRLRYILQSEGHNPDDPPMTPEEERDAKNKIMVRLRKAVYNWRPVDYTQQMGLQHLVGRSPPEFAVLTRVFSEIRTRLPEWRPRSLFDFGSGVGSTLWAAEDAWGAIHERFCVDTSADMNDLSCLILRGGRTDIELESPGLMHRQFLPASTVLKYDLVVSAYTLLELPSIRSRLEALENLWRRTNGLLVLVENGSLASFSILAEARDFILQMDPKSHVFAPCPHEKQCPRLREDRTPCNYEVRFQPFSMAAQEPPTLRERFCYLVMKRGARPDPAPWPRVVREVLKRPRHAICRLCTAQGELAEVVVTAKKHGKPMYRCTKSSKWGDLFPANLLPSKCVEEDSD